MKEKNCADRGVGPVFGGLSAVASYSSEGNLGPFEGRLGFNVEGICMVPSG